MGVYGTVKKVEANGETWYVVLDTRGEQLGSFGPSALNFELNSNEAGIEAWLKDVSTPLLPGVLKLLMDEMQSKAARMREAEERLGSIWAPEDAGFFGLEVDCPEKDLERAYRRVAARLHPDKGGDVASFDAMKKRYERLKEYRVRSDCAHPAPGNASSSSAAPADAKKPPAEEDEAKSAGSGGSIKWEPKDRESMIKAHEELRLQLRYIEDKSERLEREVQDIESQLRSCRDCLEDEASETTTLPPTSPRSATFA